MRTACRCRRGAPALRLVAALREGAVLVARPRSRSAVVHLHRGRLTPTGRVPRGIRPVCGARTRALTWLPLAGDRNVDALPYVLSGGRRLCRSCMALTGPAGLTDRHGRHRCPDSNDERAAAYRHLTVDDLAVAGAWARTLDESYEIDTIALLVHGPKPILPKPRLSAAGLGRLRMHEAIEQRRRDLIANARPPEEAEQNRAAAEAEAADRRRLYTGERREAAVERARTRRLLGKYLTPSERELLADHEPRRTP